MPAVELMGWNKVQKRWFKKHPRTKQVVMVGCPTLEKRYPDLITGRTKEESRDAANRFWRELMSEEAAAENQVLADAETLLNAGQNFIDGVAGFLNPAKSKAKPPKHSLRALADKWLMFRKADFQGDQIKAGTVENSRKNLEAFIAWFASEKNSDDISTIDEMTLGEYRAYLMGSDLSTYTKRDYLAALKMFLRWAALTVKALPIPANLFDRSLAIKLKTKKQNPFTDDEVELMLKSCEGQQRLYYLMMLNTGCLQAEVASIEHADIDFTAGTITIRRQKEGDCENVPTVTYALWSETLNCLKECLSDHPVWALVGERGNQLRTATMKEGGGTLLKRNDPIGLQYRRWNSENGLGLPMLKQLRKTSVSKLDNHGEYARYSMYFMGHSPRTVLAKFYLTPSQDQFNAAVLWLGEQFGLHQG